MTHDQPVPSLRTIAQVWWPLAASWLLMGLELPALSAVVARLPNPEINLAAYGGIVFPLALIIESPIIMLLAASTALSKDWASYLLIRRFMWVAGILLTVLHVLIAFTPLYTIVARDILGVPPEILEPGRVGLQIMTPWTMSIAYRRTNQGVMIRFGHSKLVGTGTIVRLLGNLFVLTIGYTNGTVAGIVVATSAVALGVVSEALYVGWRVRPILQNELRPAPPAEPLTWKAFYAFYIPLALTSLIQLIWNPIGSAALSRMPQALPSLAVWPVVSGLIFMLRSLGIAFNEVVVAVLDRPGSYPALSRFTGLLLVFTTLAHGIIALTPLSMFWFGQISALEPELAGMAQRAFIIAIPLAGITALQSWYQGAILFGRQTRGIPESVAIFLLSVAVVLWIGIANARWTGLFVGMVGFVFANLTQTAWLWLRSRPVLASVRKRDRIIPYALPAD